MAPASSQPVFYRRLDRARLTLPPPVREHVDDTVAVSAGIAGCVLLTPVDVWKRDMAALREYSADRYHTSQLLRFRIASEMQAHVDTRGRVVIPRLHREWARIIPDNEVVILPQDDCAQIWQPRRFGEHLKNVNRGVRQLNAAVAHEQLPLIEE